MQKNRNNQIPICRDDKKRGLMKSIVSPQNLRRGKKRKGIFKDYEKDMKNPIKSPKIRRACGQLKATDFVKGLRKGYKILMGSFCKIGSLFLQKTGSILTNGCIFIVCK